MAVFSKIIKSITRGQAGRMNSPLLAVKTTWRWLDNLSGSSEYDMHHSLVEGLERFNGGARGDAPNRIKMLRVLEGTGLPLQAGIVSQYLNGRNMPESAKKSLWRECQLFWDQLAVAYLSFLKPALNVVESGELESQNVEIVVKSLRYSALTMRWEYFRGGRPGESAWLRLHKMYRMAEMAGMALSEVKVEGRQTNCVQEYVRALLYDLANISAFSTEESRVVMEILDDLDALPVPEIGLQHGRHSHMVDLSSPYGPKMITDRWVPGNRLRYLEFQGVLDELERRATIAQADQERIICKRLSKIICRAGAHREGPRQQRFGEMQAVFGIESVRKALSPVRGMVLSRVTLVLRDEGSEGLGFVMDEERQISPGCLLAVDRDEGNGNWQLLSVRWVREEGGQWLLGAESLSKHPKLVDVEWETDNATKETQPAIFLPLAGTKQGMVSNLLLPHTAYALGRVVSLRDTSAQYRLKLGEIIETHESWLRVGFDVLSREAA
jgi:hypothetical protein